MYSRMDNEGKTDAGRLDTRTEKVGREVTIWSSANWLISSRNHESRVYTRAIGKSQG